MSQEDDIGNYEMDWDWDVQKWMFSLKTEEEIRARLDEYRKTKLFWDNSMDVESGVEGEHLCRELEWVLDLPHEHERYRDGAYKVWMGGR